MKTQTTQITMQKKLSVKGNEHRQYNGVFLTNICLSVVFFGLQYKRLFTNFATDYEAFYAKLCITFSKGLERAVQEINI